jgi:hypothetical protein
VLRLRNYDLLVGAVGRGDVGRLAGLRTAEDIFCMMGRPVPIARQRDLAKLAPIVTRAGVLNGVSVKNTLWGSRRHRSHTFTCFVKQDRDREVRRKRIAAEVTARVASLFPRWRQADPAEIEFWGFYIEGVLHLGLRVSDERMKYRGKAPQRRKGALRPTIAAALALLADPSPGSFVVDPMCGTGTILEEAFAREERARYAGGDSAQEAVDLARQRLGGHGIAIERWDARRVPLGEAEVDCIVCNLPFGKRYSTPGQNPSLYRALVSNWHRKLKPRGRMILLTADSRALEDCLLGLRLGWRRECRVKVLGAWATVYAVGNAPAGRATLARSPLSSHVSP